MNCEKARLGIIKAFYIDAKVIVENEEHMGKYSIKSGLGLGAQNVFNWVLQAQQLREALEMVLSNHLGPYLQVGNDTNGDVYCL